MYGTGMGPSSMTSSMCFTLKGHSHKIFDLFLYIQINSTWALGKRKMSRRYYREHDNDYMGTDGKLTLKKQSDEKRKLSNFATEYLRENY